MADVTFIIQPVSSPKQVSDIHILNSMKGMRKSGLSTPSVGGISIACQSLTG